MPQFLAGEVGDLEVVAESDSGIMPFTVPSSVVVPECGSWAAIVYSLPEKCGGLHELQSVDYQHASNIGAQLISIVGRLMRQGVCLPAVEMDDFYVCPDLRVQFVGWHRTHLHGGEGLGQFGREECRIGDSLRALSHVLEALTKMALHAPKGSPCNTSLLNLQRGERMRWRWSN